MIRKLLCFFGVHELICLTHPEFDSFCHCDDDLDHNVECKHCGKKL